MPISDLKSMARQAVHDTLAVPCVCSRNGTVLSDELTVSLRSRNRVHGDLDGDYAQINESVDRLRFNRPQLAARSIVLRRGDVCAVDGEQYELDQQDPDNGPVHAHWSVVRVAD